LASQVIEPSDQPADHLAAVAACEVIGSKVLVRDAVLKHMVGGGDHGGGYREDRLFGAAARASAVELALQVGVLDPHRCPSGGYQSGFKPSGTLAHTCGTTLAGTLVAARTQSGPGHQVRS